MTRIAAILVLFMATTCLGAADAFRLQRLFGSNQVLQRDTTFSFRGVSEPGAGVLVQWPGGERQARADAAGNWAIAMPALPAGGPYAFHFVCAGRTLTLDNVLVGDVWLVSGQSNMEYKVKAGLKAGDQAAAVAANPLLRYRGVSHAAALAAEPDIPGGDWQECGPATAPEFSAIGSLFGRRLQHELGIPIGIIDSSFGGSSIEAWLSPDDLESRPHQPGPKLPAAALNPAAFPGFYVANEAAASMLEPLARDSYLGLTKGVHRPEYDDAGWPTIALPLNDQAERQIHWLRKEFVAPEDAASGAFEGSLGRPSSWFTVYLNGTEIVRGTGGPCRFKVPAGLLLPGKNVMVMRVANPWWPPYMESDGADFYLRRVDETWTTPLTGAWKGSTKEEPALPPFVTIQTVPSVLYQAMIRPLFGLKIAGVLWYQGENNGDQGAQYRALFTALIENWRKGFGNEAMPFYFVQLANFGTPSALPEDRGWPFLREAQAEVLDVNHTGMVSAIDLGDPFDIHPKDKGTVAERLAQLALTRHYHRAGHGEGPRVRSVSFLQYGAVLEVDSGIPLVLIGKGASGFSLAGADRVFHLAEARLEDGKIRLHCAEVQAPVALRYGWAKNPILSVFDERGLPLRPYRSDRWPEQH